jgi:alpha-tubulin suppressor-like RCC1 family protein
MREKTTFLLFTFLALTACGTLKVEIVYDHTPPAAETESPAASTSELLAESPRTPTPAIRSSATIAAPAATATPSSPAVSKITAIAAGYNYTCALTAAGGVLCWGLNDKGQLGDGTQTNRKTPAPVKGLSGGVASVAAGGTHTCALMLDGRVKCWGENLSGQLGDGTQRDSLAPMDVVGLNGNVTAVAAGGGHTCAITEYGTVQCWGWNDAGQLGDGKTADNKIPGRVGGLDGSMIAIAAGYKHTCALMENGGIWCWGWNGSGQLGNRTNLDSSTPVLVDELSSPATGLTAGEGHT